MRVHGHRFTGVDVTVSLDRDPERELTIPVTSTPMNGASTADYFGVPETLTFAAGGPIAKGIRLGATDDAIDDDDEAVLLDFGPGALPERVQKSASPGMTVNIIDNDMRGLALSSGGTRAGRGQGRLVHGGVDQRADGRGPGVDHPQPRRGGHGDAGRR